jgi:receptor protein-tyrosine kinase
MSSTAPQRHHLVERATVAARAALAAEALPVRVPRPPLVERAADAARAALAAEALFARTPQSPLASPEVVPAALEAVVVPAAPRSQAIVSPSYDAHPPITNALLRRAGLVGTADPAREEIALVREQVLRSVEATHPTKERQPRLVVITSARSGAGTSFAALNLAASIAEGTDRHVVLVDAAHGANSLTARLRLLDSPGLGQLRDTGRNDPAGLLLHTEIPGLFVLPHGTTGLSSGPGSVVEALRHLAERLPDHLILLDAPACLESSIAGQLAGAAGQVALVVEAERTKRAEVETALDILDACPTLQLLLNRSALRVSDRFGGAVPQAGDVAVGAHQT